MKRPPTKFEVMRRNRIIAAARTRIEDAWELGYDEPGDPMVEAALEGEVRELRKRIRARSSPHRWWWPLGWVRS